MDISLVHLKPCRNTKVNASTFNPNSIPPSIWNLIEAQLPDELLIPKIVA